MTTALAASLPSAAGLQPDPVIGVYVHWPFCVTKCPYCDFNSHVARVGEDGDWIAAYRRAIAAWRSLLPKARLQTVFFGGGTPSLMPAAAVEAVLDALIDAFPPEDEDALEVTLEANPTSVEAARFAGYRSAGVNRLSLGVQALDDAALRFLGRPHDRAAALAALKIAKRHFQRVNIDLIYARPGQKAAEWEAELKEAVGFGLEHLSCYQLTIEPGTRFFSLMRRGRLRLPAADESARMFALTRALLAAAGLPAYEVSNHARPGGECRHNLRYWRYQPYLGIGPGAHSRLPLATGGVMLAARAVGAPEGWLSATLSGDGLALDEVEPLEAAVAAREALVMGLRSREGVDLKALGRRVGLTRAQMIDAGRCRRLVEAGLVQEGEGRLRLSERGFMLLDSVLVELLR